MIDSIPPPPPACIAAITTLRYPPLALMAHVEGSVTLRMTRNAAGRAEVTDVAGHGLLKPAVERAVAETIFPDECSEPMEFHFQFVIRGAPGDSQESRVTIQSANHMQIERPPTGLVCALDSTQKTRPWYRRFFTRSRQ